MQGRVLFGCESVYQLMNAIILAMTECAGRECDVVLSSQTPWREELVANLAAAGIFGKIIHYNSTVLNDRFWSASLAEERRLYGDPAAFFGGEYMAPLDYEALYFPIDHVQWTMHYHACRKAGGAPEVHLYDEGVRSYTMPIHLAETQPYANGVWGKDSFFAGIKALHLHRPELYSVGTQPFELKKIPSVTDFPEVKETILKIYGKEQLPDERYVYLEDFFFADRCVSNDFTLFTQFMEIVGKTNIIVKRHPRDDANRYAPLGVKEFAQSVVPWEVQLLGNDYSRKVLVSVTSTSLLTPVLIFDYPFHVISLEKMFRGENPTHKDAAFQKFMSKFRGAANGEQVRFHTPTSVDELRDTIRFLEMVQPS